MLSSNMATISCYNKDLAIKQVSRGAIILIFSTHLCVCVCVCVRARARAHARAQLHSHV